MESMSRTWRLLWCKVCLWPGDFQVNLINSVFKVMILTIGATEWGHLEGVCSFRFISDAAKRIDKLNL